MDVGAGRGHGGERLDQLTYALVAGQPPDEDDDPRRGVDPELGPHLGARPGQRGGVEAPQVDAADRSGADDGQTIGPGDAFRDEEVALRVAVGVQVRVEPGNRPIGLPRGDAHGAGQLHPRLAREGVQPQPNTGETSGQCRQQTGLRRARVHEVEAGATKETDERGKGARVVRWR